MAGVGDEALLLIARCRQRADHGGEALGQAADLADAVDRHRRRQILCAGDALGRIAQALDRAHDAPGDEPTQQRGGRHAAEAKQEKPELQTVEHLVDLGQLPCRLDRTAFVPRHRVHPVVVAIDRHRAQPTRAAYPGKVEVGLIARQRRAPLDTGDHRPVGVHELRRRRGLQVAGGGAVAGAGPETWASVAGLVLLVVTWGLVVRIVGAGHERFVDTRSQLIVGRHERAHRRQGAHQRGDHREPGHDPPAQAHGSRNT